MIQESATNLQPTFTYADA